MEIRIQNREEIDTDAWNTLTLSYSFFQTTSWIDTCRRGIPRSRSVLLAAFDQDLLLGGIPAIITEKFGSSAFLSMPFDTYGGLICDKSISADVCPLLIEKLRDYFTAERFGSIRIVDFFDTVQQLPVSGFTSEDVFTHIIDLRGSGGFAPPDKKIAGHIRKGERAGLEIMPFQSSSDTSAFYALYKKTERRHGRKRTRLNRLMFESILEQLGQSPQLLWIAAWHEQTMVASQINFVHGKTIFNWQTVSDYEYHHLKPNHMLLKHVIDYGLQHGLQELNLGASPPEAAGLIDYKSRWGGRQRNYKLYTKRRGVRKLLGR
jgi:hypothetical protein